MVVFFVIKVSHLFHDTLLAFQILSVFYLNKAYEIKKKKKTETGTENCPGSCGGPEGPGPGQGPQRLVSLEFTSEHPF